MTKITDKTKEKTEKKDPTIDPVKNDETIITDETKNIIEGGEESTIDPTIDPVKNDETPAPAVIEPAKEKEKDVEKKAPSKELKKEAVYLDFDTNEISFKGMTEAEKLIKVMNTKFDKKTLNAVIQTEFKDDDKVTDETTNLIEDHMKYKMFYQKFN